MIALRGSLNAGLVKALGINHNVPVLSNVLSSSFIVLKREQTTVPQSGTQQNGKCRLFDSCLDIFFNEFDFFSVTVALDTKKKYSPFQNTNNMAEFAVARLDDLLNWGRKVVA